MTHDHAHVHPHDHAHPHEEHDHAHPHGEEAYGEPEAGAVLDIGGDVGALLLLTGPDRLGVEVHVAPTTGQDGYTVHTIVRAHNGLEGPVPAGLFPALPAGTYRLVGLGDDTELTVTGGEVTTHQLVAVGPAQP